jgi:meiosis-specific protein HOP1
MCLNALVLLNDADDKFSYHSVKDNRMPVKFICFDCRVRSDISWEFIKVDLYPKMLSKFKELALFRFS